MLDTKGAIYEGRQENMNEDKIQISKTTNINKEKGNLKEIIKNSDVFIGLS